jgi:hypothetical protein
VRGGRDRTASSRHRRTPDSSITLECGVIALPCLVPRGLPISCSSWPTTSATPSAPSGARRKAAVAARRPQRLRDRSRCRQIHEVGISITQECPVCVAVRVPDWDDSGLPNALIHEAASHRGVLWSADRRGTFSGSGVSGLAFSRYWRHCRAVSLDVVQLLILSECRHEPFMSRVMFGRAPAAPLQHCPSAPPPSSWRRSSCRD